MSETPGALRTQCPERPERAGGARDAERPAPPPGAAARPERSAGRTARPGPGRGPRRLVLRSRGGRIALRVPVRSAAVTAGLLAVLLVAAALSLTLGEYRLGLGEALRAAFGEGEPAPEFIVDTVRLPRLLTAVAVGAALAVSGGVLQSLTRNPLGSPDVIGFTNGSATGALIVIVVFQGSMTQVALGALAGGLGTAVVMVLLLAGRGLHGFRVIVIGIGVSAMLLAANSYLITRADLHDALEAQSWLTGSLNSRGWDHATPVGVAVLVLLPLAFAYGRRLAVLEMGDDTARALGVDAGRSRLILLGLGVALAAVATAATGPIWFIALAAPQLARRLAGGAGPGLLPTAVLGAVLLVAGDLAVQRVFAPTPLPVGIATGTIGGLYLIWLLIVESRRRA